MTTATLRKQFKAATKRVDKAIARYKNLVDSLWVENAEGELVHATPYCFKWFRGAWHLKTTSYLTGSFDRFYRIGRGEKRLAETWGEFKPFSVKRVDYALVKKLEDKIDVAFSKRDRIWEDLSAAGVDVWNDKELWQ